MSKPKKPSFDDMDSFVKAPPKPEPQPKEVESPRPSSKVGRPKVNKYPTDASLTIRLPRDIHKQLKRLSVELEKPMAEIVVDSVMRFLKE